MNGTKSFDMNVSDIVGMTMRKVIKIDDAISFESIDGRKFFLSHIQKCCEIVTIEDIAGDLLDLVGTPILLAEEVSSEDIGAETWTFYKFATMSGYVTIRFYGSSENYSTKVDFYELADLYGCVREFEKNAKSEYQGSKWYLNGKIHREDGPALEHVND